VFDTAAAIEAAEARAWADLYRAAPPAFAATAGLGSSVVAGALVLRWAATRPPLLQPHDRPWRGGARHSRGRGRDPAGVSPGGHRMFPLQSLPHCRPTGFEQWLRERGLEPFDAQDRVVRGPEPLSAPRQTAGDRDLAVERVGAAAVDEWAEFLQRVYRLDTGPARPPRLAPGRGPRGR
jgi:hypothetical protein